MENGAQKGDYKGVLSLKKVLSKKCCAEKRLCIGRVQYDYMHDPATATKSPEKRGRRVAPLQDT
jgi:hypothetical protein